jgi:hypothetical protein
MLSLQGGIYMRGRSLLTHHDVRSIVVWWEELTPRGNMVHLEVKREDGVQDQLVLGSLKSPQDLRRT